MMHKPHHLTRYTDEPREQQESADPRRWKALAVLSLAQLMLILDLTVVNVALPNLGADLDLSRTAFTWAVSAYTLFFGGLMLLGGRFVTRGPRLHDRGAAPLLARRPDARDQGVAREARGPRPQA